MTRRPPNVFRCDDYPALWEAEDVTAAIQRAVDDAEAYQLATGARPVVVIPAESAPRTFLGPVWLDGHGATIVHEEGGRLAQTYATGHHGFLVGISRAGGGANLPDARYRPDLFGLLDASAAAAPGRRWGIDNGAAADAWVVAQAGSLSHGPESARWRGLADRWRETGALTIDVAVRAPDGGPTPPNTFLCGVGGQLGIAPAPWALSTASANVYALSWATQAERFGPATTYSATLDAGAATGTHRVAFVIDAAAGRCSGYLDGRQVALGGTTTFPPAAFNENFYWPFVILGDLTGTAPSGGGRVQVLGLSPSASARYADRGAGAAQVVHPQVSQQAGNYWDLVDAGWSAGGTFTIAGPAGTGTATITAGPPSASSASIRAAVAAALGTEEPNLRVTPGGGTPGAAANGDWPPQWNIVGIGGYTLPAAAAGMCDGSGLTGQAITDLDRYFAPNGYFAGTHDDYAIGHLDFAEDPAAAPRHLAVAGGRAAGSVACSALLLNRGSLDPLSVGYAFRGLALDQPSGRGIAIVLGHALQLDVRDSTIRGGQYAIGCLMWGANYYHTIRDSTLTGTEGALFLHQSQARVENVTSGAAGANRHYILALGTVLRARGITLGGTGSDPIALAYCADGPGGGSVPTVIEDVTSDNEGVAPYALAACYYEPTAYAWNNLRLRNWVVEGGCAAVPAVVLRSHGGPPIFQTCQVAIENFRSDSPVAAVDSDGGFVISLRDAGDVVVNSANGDPVRAYSPNPTAPLRGPLSPDVRPAPPAVAPR